MLSYLKKKNKNQKQNTKFRSPIPEENCRTPLFENYTGRDASIERIGGGRSSSTGRTDNSYNNRALTRGLKAQNRRTNSESGAGMALLSSDSTTDEEGDELGDGKAS